MLSDREVNALRASGKFENIFRELDSAELLNGNNMYGDFLGKSALELYLDFNDQGHCQLGYFKGVDTREFNSQKPFDNCDIRNNKSVVTL